MANILDALIVGGCERFVTVSEYMANAPREEEQRLSTQLPGEGYGEMPLPPFAESLPEATAGGAAAQADVQIRRMSGASMRTQPAHAVTLRDNAGMRIQPARGSLGRPFPVAPPELLMMGIVTNGQAVSAMRHARTGSVAPFPLVRAAPVARSQPRSSALVPRWIPQLLSDPDLQPPTRKLYRGRRDVKRSESNPG
jgi:hypothetical protein